MSFRESGEVRANSRAVALPMPEEAPVMRIVLPERRFETAEDMVRTWGRVVLRWEDIFAALASVFVYVLGREFRRVCEVGVDLVVSRWDGRFMVGMRARRGGMGGSIK